jgi:hypothetical protein
MDQLDIKRDSVSLATSLLLNLNRPEIQKCIDSGLYENFDCIVIGSNVDTALKSSRIKTIAGAIVHSTYFVVSEPILNPVHYYSGCSYNLYDVANYFMVPYWIACPVQSPYDPTLFITSTSETTEALLRTGMIPNYKIDDRMKDITRDLFVGYVNQDGFNFEYAGFIQHRTSGYYHLVFAFSKNKPKTCCHGCRASN